MKKLIAITALFVGTALGAAAGVVRSGNGSYSDSFPGVDAANRNGYPAGNPMLSGNALLRPAPTNEWYSSELIKPHADHIFNYPLSLPPTDKGLAMINAIPGGATPADRPITIGVDGVECANTMVSDYSDWGVTLRWENGNGKMDATILLGSPMVYFTKESSRDVKIVIGMGTAETDGNRIYVNGSYNGASYVVFAPEGSRWNANGNTYTSSLGGKNYWSVAMLPQHSDARKGASVLEPYAFVFPKDTKAEYRVDSATQNVITTYSVTPDVKEGSASKCLMGLLPHHYGYISGAAPEYAGLNYKTVRGELRMAAGNSFETTLRFSGVLPYLPAVDYTEGEKSEVARLAEAGSNSHGLQDWTDSYNDGQLINRLVQIAEAARSVGDEAGFRKAYDMVKQRVERWLSCAEGDVAFMFYYHKPWSTMLGYPAGHGQDTNINDHHFHWGYYIRGAALVAQYDKEWASGWGEMVNLLVRDAASTYRNDPMFPYLRNFSPYAGHCWADGTGSMTLGNNQESSSESMNFNTALILWGDVSGNKAIRDLGIYLYATERSAVEEYWFDVNSRTMPAGYNHALVCRVWGNHSDFDNFWGGGPGGSYGIQIYPVTAGSFYLANTPGYARKLWTAMTRETNILNFEENGNIWYDTWLRMLAMYNSDRAIELYEKAPQKLLGAKFGESRAHTYQWLMSMKRLGRPDMEVTSDHPLAMTFDNYGLRTYVARNNTSSQLPVKFSDGYTMVVQPNSTGVERKGQSNPPENPEPPEIPEGEDPGTGSDPDPGTGDDPGSFDGNGCLTVGSLASEGTFHGDYTVKCESIDDDTAVKITASFAGDYEGFAGPWLHNVTSGFMETGMTGDQKSATGTISGLKKGDKVTFRVKIAYSGGLAVTGNISYTVGDNCVSGYPTGLGAVDTDRTYVYPNPTRSIWNVTSEAEDGEITLWTLDGRLCGRYMMKGGKASVDASGYLPGMYLLHLATHGGSKTIRVIRQ